jgi:hypothetical protein
LLGVEEVPDPLGVVAELEELELEDELGVVLDVGVLVVVLVVVVVLDEELELVVGVVFRQSWSDSDWTVCAPWSRFRRSVGETVTGRLTTASLNCLAAFAACPQFFADTA